MTKISWFMEIFCMVKTTAWVTVFLHCISNASQTQHILWHFTTTLKLFSAIVTPLPLTEVALIHPAWEWRNEDKMFSRFSWRHCHGSHFMLTSEASCGCPLLAHGAKILWCLAIKDVIYRDALREIYLLKRLERFYCTNQTALKKSGACSFHSYHDTYGDSNKKWPWHTATWSSRTKIRTCGVLMFQNTIFVNLDKEMHICKLWPHHLYIQFARAAFYLCIL